MTKLLIPNRHWQYSLYAIALVLMSPAFAHEETAASQSPIATADQTAFEIAAKTVDGFHQALSKGDRGAAQLLLDDNVQIYEQGWVERSKAEYASHHLDSDIEFTRAVSQAQTARSGAVIGDIAYVATEGRTTGKFEGKDIDAVTLETMVLRRIEGAWRIVHIHWSSRKAKA